MCPTLCNPVDCSPPGSSIRGIFQARILGCVAISSSRGASQPRDWTHYRKILHCWVTGEAYGLKWACMDTSLWFSHAFPWRLLILGTSPGLLVICPSPLVKCLPKYFACFKNLVVKNKNNKNLVVFLLFVGWRSLRILNTSPSSEIVNFFPPECELSMHFLIGDLKKNWRIVDLQYHVSFSCIAKWFSYVNSVFWWEGNFDSDESQFISFFPVCLVLLWLERNLLLPWGQKGFLLYFLPEGSGVYVYVPDPSRFYFCAELKVEVQFFSMPYPVVPGPSFKNIFSPCWIDVASWLKNQLATRLGVRSWIPGSVSH